ncbi:MAG: TrkA family potassium uptake protein [Pirellulaceae bacterium]
MKRFVVVGLGNFGFALCQRLSTLGHEVIAVDLDAQVVDRIGALITRAAVADATDVEVLRQLGGENADAGIVSTGDDITASILSTMALQDLKIKEIFVKVISADHARVMERLGVSETVFPERDTALALASKVSGKAVLNYFKLGSNFSIQEMGVPSNWEGKTIGELQVRKQFGVNIVAIHDILTDKFSATPGPDYCLKDSDTLFIGGNDSALKKIAEI